MAKLFLNNELNIFHQFKEVGGTLYEKEKESGFVIGVSQSIALTMTPDTKKLFKQPSFVAQTVPLVMHILKATAVEEIDAIHVSKMLRSSSQGILSQSRSSQCQLRKGMKRQSF